MLVECAVVITQPARDVMAFQILARNTMLVECAVEIILLVVSRYVP
jgi:hypothetical protein